jgi:hypothetical protein
VASILAKKPPTVDFPTQLNKPYEEELNFITSKLWPKNNCNLSPDKMQSIIYTVVSRLHRSFTLSILISTTNPHISQGFTIATA